MRRRGGPALEEDGSRNPACDRDEPFRTGHLHGDLKGRSVRGGTVTLASQGAKFLLGLGSTMILARLLTPADFGLIAKLYLVIGFAEIVKDLGLSMASVQRAVLTHRLASNLFWMNLAAGVGLAIALIMGAPWIALAYDDPAVEPVLQVFAAMFLLGSLAAQHQALLQRQMRFLALASIEIAARVAGIASAVLLAAQGYGHWALVANLVVYAGAFALAMWPATGWVPGLPSLTTGFQGMLRFGTNLTLVNLLNHVNRSIDRLIIGRFAGDAAAGLYDRAHQLLLLPLNQVNAPVTAVAIPALSRLQDEPARFRAAYLRAVSLICTMAAPLVVFMFVWTEQIVRLVLGPQWLGAIDLFRILALAGLTKPLANTIGWLFIATGRTAEALRWRLATLWITPVASPLALHFFGVTGVAWSLSLLSLILTGPAVWYAQRGSGIGTAAILRTAARPTLAAVLGGAMLWPLVGHVHVLLALPLMPVAFFAAACLLAGSFAPLQEIWSLRGAFLARRSA